MWTGLCWLWLVKKKTWSSPSESEMLIHTSTCKYQGMGWAWNKRHLFSQATALRSLTSDYVLLFFIFSQTVALWLRNTNYREKQEDFCFNIIQKAANDTEVKLFQRKSVFELVWGYTDPFLAALVAGSKPPPPFPQCPGPEGGLTDFVQVQVHQILQWYNYM